MLFFSKSLAPHHQPTRLISLLKHCRLIFGTFLQKLDWLKNQLKFSQFFSKAPLQKLVLLV